MDDRDVDCVVVNLNLIVLLMVIAILCSKPPRASATNLAVLEGLPQSLGVLSHCGTPVVQDSL